jgi:hypothetical protein
VEDILIFYFEQMQEPISSITFNGKTQGLKAKLVILWDNFHCDVEQMGMFDWTFIHGRQLHTTLSPMEKHPFCKLKFVY